MATGANTTPLGRMNPVTKISNNAISLLNPTYMSANNNNNRITEQEIITQPIIIPESDSSERRRRKRKSRWEGDVNEKVFIPGMPTVLPSNLNPQQERAYLLQLQIEEISRRLRTGDLGIPLNPEERSPSPEPLYNNEGKRLNTREYRTRKKLEDDRHSFIQEMYTLNPEYKPPPDYKPPMVRVSEKVMIPQEEHPDINFVGLLIGPRGNTLKSMEKETGAKIIIRGKGSVKEGKVLRKDGHPLPGEDEPLNAFITGNSIESVKKAVDKIKEIIRQGVEVPEGQNDLRRMQLRELALLNGTLRENDGPRCTNCGAITHRSWQCPDKPNITNNVICTNCGGAGHISKDCREKPTAETGDKSKIDEEYMSLMAELGEGSAPPPKAPALQTAVPQAWKAPIVMSNQWQQPQAITHNPQQMMYQPMMPQPPSAPTTNWTQQVAAAPMVPAITGSWQNQASAYPWGGGYMNMPPPPPGIGSQPPAPGILSALPNILSAPPPPPPPPPSC